MEPLGTSSEPPPARGPQRGFSLVEIMVALFFLIIIVTAVSRTYSNAKKVQQGAYYIEQASSFAQAKMDQLSAASLRNVVDAADTVTTPLGPKFIRSWTTVDHGGTKEVQVTVNWTVAGKAHGVKLATMVQ
jgi:Tfp pilus assembly protein PilV